MKRVQLKNVAAFLVKSGKGGDKVVGRLFMKHCIVIGAAFTFSPIIALCLIVFLIAVMVAAPASVDAEDVKAAEAASPKVVATDGAGNAVNLPQAPEPLQALIKIGKVRFEFYDPSIVRRVMAGETRYEFQYSYKSRSSWRRIVLDFKPAIKIAIKYSQVKLERTHRIFLPQEMIRDDIFARPLTLHEFDHVAISCDTRLPFLLETMLNERNAELVTVLNEEEHGFQGTPTPQDLARISKILVKEASNKVFDDLVNIVAIRYKELDRISENGAKPLSVDDRYRIIESPLNHDDRE